MTNYLFSYGTLQLSKVQLESFGRLLTGSPDILPGYKLSSLEITDELVLAKSEQKYHPIAIPSNNEKDAIEGTVFKVSQEEILMADKYEVDDYKRVSVVLESGKEAWVYIAAKQT